MRAERSEWVDRHARDNRGDLIGVVVDVYDDPLSRQPAWLAISTGFFGTRIAVAPLREASLLGDDVVIAHPRHTITTAPHVEVVVTIDPADQHALDHHYSAVASPSGTDPIPSPHESST